MLAKYFGVISPKISTATVMTAVESVVASNCELRRTFPNNTVPKADAVKLTMLLPIRIAVISLSYFSSAKAYTALECFLPKTTMLFSLTLFAQE